VYAKPIKLHKGVKNKIQFQFLNQEQKPVDVTGKEISFRLLSDDNKSVLMTKALITDPTMGALPLTGIAILEVTEGDLSTIISQMGRYSLEWKDDGSTQAGYPVFSGTDSNASGVAQIVDSILPEFVPSRIIGIPSHQYSVGNVPVTFYSSVFQLDSYSSVTMQIAYSAYTGTMQLQAATEVQGDWYNIGDMYTYTADTTTVGYTIPHGAHPFYRIEFAGTAGDVAGVLVR
jgi:hypothetical protein